MRNFDREIKDLSKLTQEEFEKALCEGECKYCGAKSETEFCNEVCQKSHIRYERTKAGEKEIQNEFIRGLR